jgi:hypothetical protein
MAEEIKEQQQAVVEEAGEARAEKVAQGEGTKRRGRGRPKKTLEAEEGQRRGRGRPKKVWTEESVIMCHFSSVCIIVVKKWW